jgi:hypothetical protein
MKTIHQFAVHSAGEFAVVMPEGAVVLKTTVKAGYPYMWVQLDPKKSNVKRVFRVVAAGESLPKDFAYVDTYVREDGFVGHLYEVLK